MAGKLISDLNSGTLSLADAMEIDKDVSGTRTSFKTTVKDIVDFANHNVAEEYDSTSTYAIGDYVMYESTLYKCITAVSSAENFDSTKWTAVLVTDEMGSGGGGTGGHTIIDENGTSMTARAGLQFVGANVDDDATNNKTIVELASAGGIDGVFIDTENVITTLTGTGGSFADYLATEDCFVIGTITGASGSFPAVQIDGITVAYINNSTDTIGICVSAKKGQTISYRMSSQSTLTVYGIQTGTSHSKFQPVIYSTEEREIGVWEDGKPIYQKTFHLTSAEVSYNSWGSTNIDSSDFDTIISAFGISGDKVFQGEIMAWNDNGTLKLQTGRNANKAYADTLVLQYTKISDTAGSGSWTPQGVPTHHYSTDEKVIGTWIDGKTLYEKTVSFTTGSDGAYNTYDTGILNPDTIMFDFNASYYETSNAKVQALSYWGEIPSSGYSNAFCILANKVDNKIRIDYRVGSTASGKTAYVTVRYTKSS